jgi:GTP-binding protein
VIKDFETGRVAADIREGSRVLLKGGKGGKGNARFATPTRQKPSFATAGKRAREGLSCSSLSLLRRRAHWLSDVGKSTLLAACTGARPKMPNILYDIVAQPRRRASHEASFVMAEYRPD